MPDALSFSMQIMLEAQARILALNLAGLPPENVLIVKRITSRKKDLTAATPLPCCQISPFEEETDPNAGTNVRDDIGYRYRIALISLGNVSQTLNFDRTLYWREQVRQKLLNHRFESIPTTMRITITAGPVIEPGAWEEGLDVSGLVMSVLNRETRIP